MLQGLIVVLIGLWALSATEAKASTEDYCDAYYCLPNEECTEEGVITWCDNGCPEWVYGECGIWLGICDGDDSYYYCSTHPE